MTAPRSFREAFTEDPADMKDRARLVAERDSARDWAVALENRPARVDRALDELRKRERDAGLAQGEAQRPYDYSEGHYTGTRNGIRESVLAVVAALTGGEDDARA